MKKKLAKKAKRERRVTWDDQTEIKNETDAFMSSEEFQQRGEEQTYEEEDEEENYEQSTVYEEDMSPDDEDSLM